MRARMSEAREKSEQAVLAVLTDGQKSQLETMKGAPFELDMRAMMRRGGPDGGPGGAPGGAPPSVVLNFHHDPSCFCTCPWGSGIVLVATEASAKSEAPLVPAPKWVREPCGAQRPPHLDSHAGRKLRARTWSATFQPSWTHSLRPVTSLL